MLGMRSTKPSGCGSVSQWDAAGSTSCCFEATNKPRAKIENEVIYCFYKVGVAPAYVNKTVCEGFFLT